ncbi:MAG: tail fiber domain-containing protein [Deltaproteobacteria bacterium]|nr:tail fiber domain-containing protein [Deltaproteobacteria bacterium]
MRVDANDRNLYIDYVEDSGEPSAGTIHFRNYKSGGTVHEYMTVDSAGRVGIGDTSPSYRLELPNNSMTSIGRARANAWSTYSDERVKFNQEPMAFGLEDVMLMQPKQYDHYSGDIVDGKLVIEDDYSHEIGLIAQEVYEIVPEVVSKPEDDMEDLWSMDYAKMTTVLIKGIQDLKQEKDTEIQALIKENSLLKSRLEKIERVLINKHQKH